MTYKNFGRALTLLTALGFAACGGSTTINFVGDPDSTGGEGGDSTGGRDGDGGGNLGGLGGDGSGGNGAGGGSGGGIIVLGYCGDGAISAADDEICDDGNERSRDGCSAECTVEPGFMCTGEPSQCSINLIGNGVIDPGEACDDGNVLSGDGCSSTGDVEGTCEELAVLEAVDNGAGTSVAVVNARTSSGGASAPAQACNGFALGGGNDRAYLLETDRDSDLTISVESDFDAILRIYGSDGTSTCDPDREAFCFDDAGAGETETFHYRRMPAGANIVILVDGAEEGEEGDFTLTVTQGCDADHVKLHRLTPFSSGGNTETVSLKNISDYCTVNLDTVGFAVTDDIAPGPLSVDLPELGLAPGQVFRGSFDVIDEVNPNSFDFAETPRAFDLWAAGAYVCNGPCDLDGGTNITDGVLTGTEPNIGIPGTTFLPGQPTVSNSPYESVVRVAYDGAAPNFLASDWSPAFLVDPDDYPVDWMIYYSNGTAGLQPISIGPDASEGAVVEIPAPVADATYSAVGSAVPTAVTQPTYIGYSVKTDAASAFACYLNFGIDTGLGTSTGWSGSYALTTGFKYFDVESGWRVWAAGSAYVSTVSDTSVWHTVELTNINWSAHTFDFVYDGSLVSAGMQFSDTTLSSLTHFSLSPSINPSYLIGCSVTDIIVRNGPPGRIWQSSPVLIAPD